MKLKEIIVHHDDDTLEFKETIRIKSIGSESIVIPGQKLSKRFFAAMCSTNLNEALETTLHKDPITNIWILSI